MDSILNTLYSQPFPSTRSGALFNAFSYPTKISPEAIAIFIACHTKPGATILDPFGGSGTTGIATKLCDTPTSEMLSYVREHNLSPIWGPRNAIIYELSPIGALAGDVMCNSSSTVFKESAQALLDEARRLYGDVYEVLDPDGGKGQLRYAIWSDYIACPSCKREIPYSDLAITYNPIQFHTESKCPFCGHEIDITQTDRVLETYDDIITGEQTIRRKRLPFRIYGTTGKTNWQRNAGSNDLESLGRFHGYNKVEKPIMYPIQWGILHRNGYHTGISYLHQFYTERNFYIFSMLWDLVKKYPKDIQPALKVWLLSYNLSHATMMTRVVAKKDSQDFVITGSQPGVLYISSLPVEKNLFIGLERKIKTFVDAFKLTEKSNSSVIFKNLSSTNLQEAKGSIDYVFTDPPFGDYIPYSELNQINEAWLGSLTQNKDEVIINDAQNKSVETYQHLMTSVFKGLHKAMKQNGLCTLVFHSAKSEIWQAIISAYSNSSFAVLKTSILDKKQASFKQTNSSITVKGDPLILLENLPEHKKPVQNNRSDLDIAQDIINCHSDIPSSKEKSERMFSLYITTCIELGIRISLDAEFFFQ